jgi:23S rRNA (cytosine1962-C5)-methyltransferase
MSNQTPIEQPVHETTPKLPAAPLARVVLKPRKARPFFGRHPWVLDSAIQRVEGQAEDGDEVLLVSDQGQPIARGVLNRRSRLLVRLYTWDTSESLDDKFWHERLNRAIDLRWRLGYDDAEGAARLVYSEADGLSGLIVDRYGRDLVLQINSLAMAKRLDRLVPMLVELTRPRSMVVRTDRQTLQHEGMDLDDGPCWGELPDGPVFIREHGLRYGVELHAGQKTGFYLDQRENRRAAASFTRGQRVLDMFCYSGAFSLVARSLGEAREVFGFDSSQPAVTLARANAAMNGVTGVRFETGDAFATLEALHGAGEKFGVVILDPPKFAHSRQAVDDALKAYHRLNRAAVALLPPGGTLVTCSCSGHVSREDFLHMLADVAQRTDRNIQVLEQRGAASDHPVLATCLESEYLKCMICRVS